MKTTVLGNATVGLTREAVVRMIAPALAPIRSRVRQPRVTFSVHAAGHDPGVDAIATLKVDGKRLIVQARAAGGREALRLLARRLPRRLGLPAPRATETRELVAA